MNQILTTKPVKPRKQTNIKTVIAFFAVSMIIFGICLISSGSYAVYKSLSSNPTRNSNLSNQTTTNNVETENANTQIELSSEGTSVIASVNSDKQISFITYKWDDEEENREDIGGQSGRIAIDIPGGEHILNVTAVDIDNNTTTKKIKVKGVKKPTLEVIQEGTEFVIKASDEIGIERIDFILNEQGYRLNTEGIKQKEFRYQLVEGDNKLEVTVYNTEGYTETFNDVFKN